MDFYLRHLKVFKEVFMGFRSGFVTIVGRPNVGKSTLLNKFAGEKVAIMSDKPQTTRNTIRVIVTDEESQIIFIDTPGMHKPKTKLGEYMDAVAEATLSEVDVILFMTEATDKAPGSGDKRIVEILKKQKTPVFLIINKIDMVNKESILPLINAYKDLMEFDQVIPVSALNDEGTEIILNEIKNKLPEGPKYYSEDMLTDQLEKNIAGEMIREKILHLIKDEVPHGVGVLVDVYKKRENKDIIDISATIFCEKDSHKAILIGKNGSMLKKIGSLSRHDIEAFTGSKVFLQLWVKVKPDWRNDELMLKSLGYQQ